MDKKPYTSLEHAIKNVVRESIGGPNTDKYKGTPKPFLQPAPHIEPKVGDSHPDGSSVAAKRGAAKIQQSETMKEEENIEEQSSKDYSSYSSEPGWEPTKKSIGDVAFGKLKKAKADIAQIKMGREAAKKYSPLSYKELPSEKLKHTVADTLAKVSGDPQKAEKAAEVLGKVADVATVGLGRIGYDVADSIEAAKQGRTIEAKQKAKEAAIGIGTFAAGGLAASRLAKFAGSATKTSALGKTGDIKPPSYFGPQKVKTPEVKVAEPPAPTAPPKTAEAPPQKTGGGEPPATETPKTYKYQPNAGTNRGAINARGTGARSGIGARLPDASTSASRLKRVGPMGDGPSYAPPKGPVTTGPTGPKGGGGGGGGTKIDQPSAPENVVSIKPPTETAPSNAPTAQLKTTGGAKPKPAAPTTEPAKPAPSGPQRRGTPKRDVPWRPAPAKPAAPSPAKPAPTETPKVPGMPEFKPFNPNKPFKPDVPANDPVKVPGKPEWKEPVSPTRRVVPPAPVVSPPTEKPKSPPAQKPIEQPGKKPDVGPTQQPSSQPLSKPATSPAPAAAPASAAAVATAAAAKTSTTKSTETKKPSREDKKKEERKPTRGGGGIPIPGVSPEILSALQGGYVPTKSYTHFAEPRKTYGEETEVDKIRTSIENVARPGGKTRIAKQGEIKTKIIDENAKRVATIKKIIDDKKSTVIINPKLKNPDTDQN